MRPAHRLLVDFAHVGKLLGPARRRGVNVEMGKILKLDRDLVARSMVYKASQKAVKIRTELAKRV